MWNLLQANPTKNTNSKPKHISSLTTNAPRKPHPSPHAPPPKPRRNTTPTTHQKPRPRSFRRKPYRLSQEEMNERYRKWYQGRGSEVGRGLWGVEMVGSPHGSVDVKSERLDEEKVVEVERMGEGMETNGMGEGKAAVEMGKGGGRDDDFERERRREKRRGVRGMEIPWEVGEEVEKGVGIRAPRSRL